MLGTELSPAKGRAPVGLQGPDPMSSPSSAPFLHVLFVPSSCRDRLHVALCPPLCRHRATIQLPPALPEATIPAFSFLLCCRSPLLSASPFVSREAPRADLVSRAA